MLKIDCLSLAKNDFNAEELNHLRGDATVKFGDKVVASGKFRMSNCGIAHQCAIDAAGVFSQDGEVLSRPDRMTVDLVGSFERKCFVAAGSTTVNLRCKDLLGVTVGAGDGAGTGDDTGAGAGDGAAADDSPKSRVFILGKEYTTFSKDENEFYTVELDQACPFKDRVLTVRLVDVPVATGAASDGNVNHKLVVKPDNEEGIIHFAMLCNVGRVPGRKPNKTHLEVRGSRPWKTLGRGGLVRFAFPAEKCDDTDAAASAASNSGNDDTQNPATPVTP